jgi:hypothetical protein
MDKLENQDSIGFVNKKENISVCIFQENDGIYIKYTQRNKEYIIKCITDNSYKQYISSNETIVQI